MIIKEVFMKNFGKFHNERLRFQPGINIVYGGNESGKSTLYTFFQGIFFGLRRKRGVASRTDTYTRCLPWENPSWYEGSVLFEAGKKDFRLERNFESRSQEAELYCVTDGEKMSVEEGDLEILLGGATQRIYENTAAIGQLKTRTEEGLTEELREYLTNFQTEGDFRLDPGAALDRLKDRRKEWEKEEKKAREKKERAREKLLDRIQYTREEIEDLEEKLERSRESFRDIGQDRQEEKPAEDRRESSFPLVFAALFFLGFLAGCAGAIFFQLSWLIPALIFLLGGAFLFWYFRDRGEKASARSRKEQDRAIRNERKKGQQITWKEALQDKRNLLYNLQEELEELENDNEKILKAQKEVQRISLAEKMLAKAAGNLQSRRGNFLKERTWEIFGELTQGRYQRGIIDENFQIRLDTGDRYAGLHQVSQGTAEQVYFALRMAAGELLCREEELPVILDETFAMYDDKRLCEALEWLHRNRAQVILLTCTRREIEALESLGIPFHQVDLQIGAGIRSNS